MSREGSSTQSVGVARGLVDEPTINTIAAPHPVATARRNRGRAHRGEARGVRLGP